MALSIKPSSTIEEEVYRRVIAAIPSGAFYLRATHVQPRRDGNTIVPFVIEGTRGDPSGGSRLMVDIYLNEALYQRAAMTAATITVPIKLQPSPHVNYIRVIEGTYNTSTDQFIPTGQSTGTSCVVTNYGSILFGCALDYYRKVWLPLQIQEFSLTSDWSCRQVEWYFKYHNRMPDPNALRTLAVRLTSRATWHELPTTRGVTDMVSALCCSEPVVKELTNERPNFDLALYPFVPDVANFGGWEFNIWFPDIPTAREVAVLKMARNLPYLELADHLEGRTFFNIQDIAIELFKDTTQDNLGYILNRLDIMPWKAFLEIERQKDNYLRFWDDAFDNLVTPPGLGAGDFFDTDTESFPDHDDTFDSPGVLDTCEEEPFTELWNGLGVSTADRIPGEKWDSVVQLAKAEGQVPPDAPVAWDWEWTGFDAVATTSSDVTNTMHGGAPPDFEA
jgi:hypothetical protein